MKVGASKRTIAPAHLLPMGFHDEYGKIYRDVFVRTIAVESQGKQVLFTTFELPSAVSTKRIRAAVKEKYGIDPEYVCFGATHTHEAAFSTSMMMPGMPATEKTDAYDEFIYEQAMASIDEAMANKREAKWAYTSGKSYINVCRDQQGIDGVWFQGRDFEEPSDKTLAILKFTDLEGKVIAVLMNYGMHGTACYLKKDEAGETMMIAGDVPGFVSDFVEGYYKEDGAVAAWSIAAGGNQNPIFFCIYQKYNEKGIPDGIFSTGYDAWGLCEHLGQTQGIEAVKLINAVKDEDMKTEMDIRGVDRTVKVPAMKRVGRGIKPTDEFKVEDDGEIEMQLKLTTLDDVAVYSINGELVAEIGIRLKDAMPFDKAMILSLSAESIGYIPDERGYNNRTFAFFGTRIKDGKGEAYITPNFLDMVTERH